MLIAAACIVIQATYTYPTKRGMVRLTGFQNISAVPENNLLKFSGTSGAMLLLEDTGTGMKLRAKNLTVSLQKLGTNEYSLVQAIADGAANVAYDSDIAYQASIAKAKENSGPEPAAPAENVKWVLESDNFAFDRTGADGTLKLSGKLHCTYNRVAKTQTQDIDLDAASGNVAVNISGEPAQFEPQTAYLSGPVTFDFSQNSGDEAGESSWTVKGSANELNANFVAQTGIELVLAGAVKADVTEKRPLRPGENLPAQLYMNSATVTGNEATVTLDRQSRLPLFYKFTGSPAETRIRPGGKG